MTTFSLDDVRGTFGQDIGEFLAKIARYSAELSQAPYLTEPAQSGLFELGEIANSAHSIRGTSALVNVTSIAETADEVEALCTLAQRALREAARHRAHAREIAAVCAESAEKIAQMVELELAGSAGKAGELLASLKPSLRAARRPPAPTPEEMAGAPGEEREFSFEAAEDARAEPAEVEFSFEDPDVARAQGSFEDELSEVFRDELHKAAPEIRAKFKELDKNSSDGTALNQLERLFHALKGAAATVRLGELSQTFAELQERVEAFLASGHAHDAGWLEKLQRDTDRCLSAALGVRLDLPEQKDTEVWTSTNAPSASEATDVAARLFRNEAREVLTRVFALSRELGGANLTRARALRAELGQLFHRLKGSALLALREDVAHEAEALQRACDGGASSGATPEALFGALERLQTLLRLDLREERSFDVGDSASSAASGALNDVVREAVKLTADPELWEAFEQECAEVLDELDKLILDLERSDDPKRLLEGVMHRYHTLKGAVNTIGLAPTGRQIHRIEDFLESLQKQAVLPSLRGITSFLLQVQVDVRRQLRQCEQGYVETSLARLEARISDVMAGTHFLSERDGWSGEASQASGAADASLGSGEASEKRFVRVGVDRLDMLMNLAGELVVSRSRLVSRVASLRGVHRELEASWQRLVSTVEQFREEHEFSLLNGREATKIASAPHAAWAQFSELELDRYDDINVLSRRLTEITSDVNEANTELVRELSSFTDDADQFGSIVNGIQGEVTRSRMVPLDVLFTRIRLPIRDAAERVGKHVRVVCRGQDVRLDKTIADALFTPMLHLVRNAVVHGIEGDAARVAAGKDATGVITLGAREESGQVIVEVSDDGAGLDRAALHEKGLALGLLPQGTRLDDPAVNELVFAAGLSTQKSAGSVSGRGVGGEVAKKGIERLNGSIRVHSAAGKGTTFTITLPVTLTITKALIVRHRARLYALPLHFTERIIDFADAQFVQSAGVRRAKIDGAYLRVHQLDRVFDEADASEAQVGPLVLLRIGDKRALVLVDAVVAQEEVVVKGLGSLLTGHPMFAGVTIRGTGELLLILDVPELVESSMLAESADTRESSEQRAVTSSELRVVNLTRSASALQIGVTEKVAAPELRSERALRILFVDDSMSVRKVAEKALHALQTDVTLARDGAEAIAELRKSQFDLVFTDLEMPRMHGYDLIRELRFLPAYRDIPIVVVSSRSGQKHQEQARALGANDYITKPFSQEALEQAIQRWTRSRRQRRES